MQSQKIKTLKHLSLISVALITGMASINAGASEKHGSPDSMKVTYQSHSANHNIYSYSSRTQGEVSLNPEMIYVSQANGPAIYSYAHSGSEEASPLNIGYTNKAYGQAIYSYQGYERNGEVEVLPVVTD